MKDFFVNTVGDRLSGGRPGPLRSFVVAAGVGVAAAGVTYKLLRSGETG